MTSAIPWSCLFACMVSPSGVGANGPPRPRSVRGTLVRSPCHLLPQPTRLFGDYDLTDHALAAVVPADELVDPRRGEGVGEGLPRRDLIRREAAVERGDAVPVRPLVHPGHGLPRLD